MKTLLKYTLTIVLLTFVLNSNGNTNTPPTIAPMFEESYIDDIPFDTEIIFDSLCDVIMINEFELDEEDYIQDIPFNTKEVSESTQGPMSVTFDLEDESNIDDIPFSTEAMTKQ